MKTLAVSLCSSTDTEILLAFQKYSTTSINIFRLKYPRFKEIFTSQAIVSMEDRKTLWRILMSRNSPNSLGFLIVGLHKTVEGLEKLVCYTTLSEFYHKFEEKQILQKAAILSIPMY